MSFGFQVLNSVGQVILDDNFIPMKLIGSGTTTLRAAAGSDAIPNSTLWRYFGADALPGLPSVGPHFVFVALEPFPFLKTYVVPSNGRAAIMLFNDPRPNIAYRVSSFGVSPPSQGAFGMEVYGPDGARLFTADDTLMAIKSVDTQAKGAQPLVLPADATHIAVVGSTSQYPAGGITSRYCETGVSLSQSGGVWSATFSERVFDPYAEDGLPAFPPADNLIVTARFSV